MANLKNSEMDFGECLKDETTSFLRIQGEINMNVQKIARTNNAGFVMNFEVHTSTGLRTGDSGNYPVDQTRVIDLGSLGIAEGTEIFPVVHAILGKTNSGEPHVSYSANGQIATYEVRGTTLNYSVKLIG
jgi:hypothetical protein